MASPLDGVKVLDLCRVLAGPHAGRVLADLGADVVKVEPPEGDVSRLFGKKPESAYFRQQNAGKRSITVDLTKADGRDLVLRLAAVADVVTENFRPGVMSRFGLGWPELSAVNPRLVMLSISGFGQEGPERDRASYAGVIHAETGVIARRRTPDGQAPVDLEISMADTVTGLHGVIGVLAALRLRDATGLGQHVDLAMIDAMAASDDMLPNEVAADQARRLRTAASGAAPADGGDAGAQHLRTTPSEIIDTPDGRVIVMGEFKWIWKSINERLDVVDPTPPGASLEDKVAARRAAWRDLHQSFASRAELLAALDRANLAWGIVTSGAAALSSPTLAHRGSVVEIEDPDGNYTVVRAPYRFSNGEAGVRRGAPRQDQHHDEILADWL
jgi:crotonobetainyl-CoA:carnitine CoA-transferase CaiB-like acyl-CoA transferase